VSPTVDADLFKAWGFEQAATEEMIRRETQRANEKAAAAGRTGSAFAANQLCISLLAEVQQKSERILARTRSIFESHGEAPTVDDDRVLRDRFQVLLNQESAAVQAAVFRMDVASQVVTRHAQTNLGDFREKADHEFKLVLASIRTGAASKAKMTEMNFHNSNVQVGDNNTQNNQVTVFRDILAKIDASNHTAAEKAEAKDTLGKFLKHPAVVGTIGALAAHVFKSL
jgi:hypothetical protein